MKRTALLLLLLLLPATGAIAKARPVKTVRVTVTATNGTGATLKAPKLRLTLAKGTRLKTSGRRGTVTLTGADLADGATRTLRVVIRGAKAPRTFTFVGHPCTRGKRHRAGRTLKLAVTCRLTAGAAPQPQPTEGPTPAPAPTATPTAAPTAAPGTPDTTPYPVAPYVDMTLGAPSDAPDLAAAKAATGAGAVSLGFITAKGTSCRGGWGSADVTDTATPYATALRGRLRDFVGAGGKLVLAFGGLSGYDLAQRCTSAAATHDAYKEAIDAVSAQAGVPITHIDLDVESNAGGFSGDATAFARQAEAVAQLQKEMGLVVTYTMQTEPTRKHDDFSGGMNVYPMDHVDLPALLKTARDKGVDIAAVNGMAMDYGSYYSDGDKMGLDAISVAGTIRKTLGDLYPALSDAQLYKKVGITLMIGRNDESTEHTTVADVGTLTDWGKGKLAMVAFWSLTRDHPCTHGENDSQAWPECHGIPSGPADWAYGKALAAFVP